MLKEKNDFNKSVEQKIDNNLRQLADPKNSNVLRVIEKLSPNSRILNSLNELKESNHISSLKDKFYNDFKNLNGRILKHEEVIDEVYKYDMILTESKNFVNDLQFSDAETLIDFVEKNNLIKSDYEYQSKFFILGNQEIGCKLKYIQENTDENDIKYKDRLNTKKPILLYKYTEQGNESKPLFLLISKENSYDNIFSRLRGFIFLNSMTLTASLTTLFIIILSIIGAFFFPNYFVYGFYISFIGIISCLLGSVMNKIFDNNSNRIFKSTSIKYKNEITDTFIVTLCTFLLSIMSLSIFSNIATLFADKHYVVNMKVKATKEDVLNEAKKLNSVITYDDSKYKYTKVSDVELTSKFSFPFGKSEVVKESNSKIMLTEKQ